MQKKHLRRYWLNQTQIDQDTWTAYAGAILGGTITVRSESRLRASREAL
jgi:hypothetical protein